MTLIELLDQTLQKCKEKAAKIEAFYKRGLSTYTDNRNERIRIADEAWKQLKEDCKNEGIDMHDEADYAYAYCHLAISSGLSPKMRSPDIATILSLLHVLDAI